MARIDWHLSEFNNLRNSPGIKALFESMGTSWTSDLNAELNAAQAKRKQPLEDGYVAHVNRGVTRTRLYLVAKTARAQAHEAKNSSILKLMKTSGHDVDVHGEFKNPTKGWRVHGSDELGDPIVGLD